VSCVYVVLSTYLSTCVVRAACFVSYLTLSMAFMQVRSGGCNPSLVSRMPPNVIPGPVDPASAPPLSGHGNYLPTQSQALYHNASSSPSTCCPSSGFDSVNEETNVRANAAVVDGHANVCASAVMTHVNDDNADDGIVDVSAKSLALHPGSQILSTLISFLAPLTSTLTSIALHFSLHSPPSPLQSPLLLLLLLMGSPSEIQEFSLS